MATDPVADGYTRFHALVATLRQHCPWDREQTHRSLVRYLIEETYEVVDAINALNPDDPASDALLAEELGDLLFQIEFHATIAEEEGRFTITDVTTGIHDKLVRRHPHVFGDERAANPAEVIERWEAAKQAEKPERTSPFDGIATSLPSAAYAEKVIDRASRLGFRWPDVTSATAKVLEEVDEVLDADASGDVEAIAEEVGDLLIAAVVVAHQTGVSAEAALRAATDKFRDRFERVNTLADERGIALSDTDISTLTSLWATAKQADI